MTPSRGLQRICRRCAFRKRAELAVGEQPKAADLEEGRNPLPSFARNGRLAYPGHGQVPNRDRLGRRSHGCPL